MNQLSRKDRLKIIGKWFLIFGMIMVIFCAYQYRLGSRFASWMIAFIGSLEHLEGAETAIFSSAQADAYEEGLRIMEEAGLAETGKVYLFQRITSYGRWMYIGLSAAFCFLGLSFEMYVRKREAARNRKQIQQEQEAEKIHLEKEKAYVLQERAKMGTYMENIAHQLRTPAAGMMLSLEYLFDTEADFERQERLEQCITQLARMSDMTASLLRLAQIDSGKIWMKKKKEKLDELLKDAIEATEPLLDEKGIVICRDLAEECALSCDAFWIREAFKNILKNASEHTPEKGMIQVRLEQRDGEYDIRIWNSGEMIPIEQREAIFDRFYQTNTKKKGSFGIGLHLAREIFWMHQGNVRVLESDENGTTFQMLLPVLIAKDSTG